MGDIHQNVCIWFGPPLSFILWEKSSQLLVFLSRRVYLLLINPTWRDWPEGKVPPCREPPLSVQIGDPGTNTRESSDYICIVILMDQLVLGGLRCGLICISPPRAEMQMYQAGVKCKGLRRSIKKWDSIPRWGRRWPQWENMITQVCRPFLCGHYQRCWRSVSTPSWTLCSGLIRINLQQLWLHPAYKHSTPTRRG